MIESAIANFVVLLTSAAASATSSSRGTTIRRSAAEMNRSASVFPRSRSKIFTTSYKTIVGTSVGASLSMNGANFAASVSCVRYSNQAEESMSQSSETVVAVTIVVFPFHALGDSAEFCDRARKAYVKFAFIGVHHELLP